MLLLDRGCPDSGGYCQITLRVTPSQGHLAGRQRPRQRIRVVLATVFVFMFLLLYRFRFQHVLGRDHNYLVLFDGVAKRPVRGRHLRQNVHDFLLGIVFAGLVAGLAFDGDDHFGFLGRGRRLCRR